MRKWRTRIGSCTFWIPVHISGTFYARVLQFVGEMTIIGPESIRSTFADYLQQALDDVLGEDL